MAARSQDVTLLDEQDSTNDYSRILQGEDTVGDEQPNFTVKDAAEHLLAVKNTSSALTLTDLNDSWQVVMVDVFFALTGLLPVIGFFSIVATWYSYTFSKRKLLGAPIWVICINLFSLCLDQTLDAYSYREYYREVKAGNLEVTASLESLQYNSVCNLCSIASLIVGQILGAKTIEIYADVAVYKARAKEDMQRRCPRAYDKLVWLEKYLPHLYNSDPPPVSISEMPQWSVISSRGKVLTVFSTLYMFSGMCFMASLSFNGILMTGTSGNRVLVIISICVAILTVSRNWCILVKGILTASEKIENNADQLLVFTSLVKNQDYGTWTQENRQRIRRILSGLEESLIRFESREFSRFREAFAKKKELPQDMSTERRLLNGVPVPEISLLDCVPDGELNLVIDALDETLFDGKMSFDLCQPQDIREWWELRRYLQFDFLDESCIMDYCSTCTLVLFACFLVVGFADYSLHKDLIFSGDVSRCGGAFLAAGIMLTLAIIIYMIIAACINMNSLLMRDSSILLDAAAELRLGGSVASSDKFSGIEERYNNPEYLRKMEATASLLILLEQKVTRFDQCQALFGVPITSNFRNGIFATLAATGLGYMWDFVYPLLMDLDVEELVRNGTAT